MSIRIIAAVFALSMPLCALAQQNVAVLDKERQAPEEVMVIGERVHKLRTQMMEAEIQAYDVFNKFNDDRRFTINCSIRPPTGTHFNKAVCNTGFEREATEEHARDYADNLSLGTTLNNVPQEAKIASQQEAFRQKLKQVAMAHPEFLKAMIRYTKKQKEFEEATKMWMEQN
jgi:hypothetical protein